jgi:hypothetical protein
MWIDLMIKRVHPLLTVLCICLLVSILAACRTGAENRTRQKDETLQEAKAPPEHAVFQQVDLETMDQFLSYLAPYKGEPTSLLVVRAGKLFLDTPYVAQTLERDEETLVVNLRELDCTTYAENCLAIARTVHSEEPSFEHFLEELQQIRYRDGQMDGYPSRLHYFCDWIYNNGQKGLVRECAEEIGGVPLSKEIHFMSLHPENYQQLSADPSLVNIMREQERRINQRVMYYIPEELLSEMENKLEEGDIVGITTDIEGLAIMHVGILVHVDDTIHLMHASSAAGKVVVSEETLLSYLIQSQRATGIMVARPL